MNLHQNRFQPGDVVVHRDHPSTPEVVLRVMEPIPGLHVFTTVRNPKTAFAPCEFHKTGMRQVLRDAAKPVRYGR